MKFCQKPTRLLLPGIMVLCLLSCETKKESSENTTDKMPANTVRPTHWGYSGGEGPEQWGKLDPVYALCGDGKNQSPINIDQSVLDSMDHQMSFNYQRTSLRIAFNQHVHDIIDNGHTIQINVDEGSDFELNGKKYHLKQFHFHTPTEHTIDGKNLPLEVHFVHQSDDNNLAVLSAMIVEGEENPNFAQIIKHLPTTKGEAKELDDEVLHLDLHLPRDRSAYYYTGSLTTPPCSEEVQWVVLKGNPTMSRDQIVAIANAIGDNNRPVQSLNGRAIRESTVTEVL